MKRFTAVFIAVLVLNQALFPTMAVALTGGPSQPEVKGFTPIGATDMVDLFTGDFSYNIPLMDVDGYPLNLSYQSNPRMDDEASWVGLGWSLNPGVLTRNLRGFPDDFKGDPVEKKFHMKENNTIGGSLGFTFEFFGFFGLDLSAGVYHNTFNGWGTKLGITPSISITKAIAKSKAKKEGNFDAKKFIKDHKKDPKGTSIGLGLNFDSQQGVDLTPSVNIGSGAKAKEKGKAYGLGISTSINSRKGLREVAYNMSNSWKQRSERLSEGIKLGSSFNFAAFTYFPTPTMPVNTNSFTFNATVGADAFGAHPGGRVVGWGTVQNYPRNRIVNPAFGYLFSEHATKFGLDAIYDYNRERDAAYREDMPSLPLVFGTYDLFSASGQGVSGQFRAARNDVGVFRKPYSATYSMGGTFGVEAGLGNAFHGGADVGISNASSVSRKWETNTMFDFQDSTKIGQNSDITSDILFEPCYFKATGESTPLSNPSFFQNVGGDNACYVKLWKDGRTVGTERRLVFQNNGKDVGKSYYLRGVQKQKNRTKRKTYFSFLNAYEASKVGLYTNIPNYPRTDASMSLPKSLISKATPPKYLSRLSHPAHHMSEVTVVQKDGTRYVYGIPAYNNYQEEHTFSISPNVNESGLALNRDANDFSLIGFNQTDDSPANNVGDDEYFESQHIPEYVHSFLLTNVLSPDYLDKTGDGVTDDDLGTATTINYSRTSPSYYWRIPYKKARYQEGYRSKSGDDKASYIEGSKELWYVYSVEGRTQIAQFYISPRDDGRSPVLVSDVAKTLDINESDYSKMMKLDSIQLFSKSDLRLNGEDATPIKVVHFEYNNELCQKVPNNALGEGKLTLKKLWFTYGKSGRGAFNKYNFVYSSSNPDYNIGHYDRWGFYQKNPSNYPSNLDFPYTIQSEANNYAGAWSLSEIDLPSGGKIKVQYESDDYAFIQDKRAGQMIPIEGFAKKVGDTPGSKLYDVIPGIGGGKTQTLPYRYLVVDILDNIQSEDEMKQRYLEDITELYFKALLDLDNAHKEYVFGYLNCDSDNAKLYEDNGNKKMYIPIGFAKGSKKITLHPITKAGLQLLRMNLPEYAYEMGAGDQSYGDAVKQIAHMGKELRAMFKGYDATKVEKEWCRNVELSNNSSWVRLNNPTFKKYGGGSRVANIKVYDSWNTMGGGQELIIGQEYDYSMAGKEIGIDFLEKISSGVASYEPLLGGDEISLHHPEPYQQNVVLAPSNSYYTETPIGESLFPAPVVGYSKVTVRSIDHTIRRTGTGYSVNKFYTAKDFPVISDYTNLSDATKHVKPLKILKAFFVKQSDRLTASQGYKIEVNDMHGKPKSEEVFNESGSLISSKQYFYHTDTNNPTHLNNTVTVIDLDGHISSKEIGKEIDVWQEMQEDITKGEALNISVNGEGFFIPFLPPFIYVPPVLPKYNKSEDLLRTSVTTKLIKRFGMIDSIVVMENGSRVTTKNLLYDSETGSVLLTNVENEFGNPVYNFTYPAHWAYDGMGLAYRNSGISFDASLLNNLVNGVVPNELKPYLVSGDELLITHDGNSEKYYVVEDYDKSNLRIIDVSGSGYRQIASKGNVKIIRSGRRNLASNPIGSVTSLADPRKNGILDMTDAKPINASVIQYRDTWKVPFCEWGTRKAEVDFRWVNELYSNDNLSTVATVSQSSKDYVQCADSITVVTDSEVMLPTQYFPGLSGLGVDYATGLGGTGESTVTFTFYFNKPVKNLEIEISDLDAGGWWSPNHQLDIDNPDEWLSTLSPVPSSTCGEVFLDGSGGGTLVKPSAWNSLGWLNYEGPVDSVTFTYHRKGMLGISFPRIRYDCSCCGKAPSLANPIVVGAKGIWHPDTSRVYYSERNQWDGANSIVTKTDGDLKDFVPFWQIPSPNSSAWTYQNSPNWVENSIVTKYSTHGQELENVDPIGIYSSAQFGYNESLPIAICQNSPYHHQYNENFEDYFFTNDAESCSVIKKDIDFSDASPWAQKGSPIQSRLTDEKSHTGMYSLVINPTDSVWLKAQGGLSCGNKPNYYFGLDTAYHLGKEDQLLPFLFHVPSTSPRPIYKKLFSFWVASDSSLICNQSIKSVRLEVAKTQGVNSVPDSLKVFSSEGDVIDGWQRFYVAIPAGWNKIVIKNLNNSEGAIYIDDVRIHPFDANMKSYVYDPNTLRLMAELDENNYATFYEYDDEGNLVRVKRETNDGIKTIQESRTVLKKNEY